MRAPPWELAARYREIKQSPQMQAVQGRPHHNGDGTAGQWCHEKQWARTPMTVR
jgi:hypothetical protein